MPTNKLEELCLYAWVGEDEHGSGEIGLKQGLVPAGYIPLVATRQDKIDRPALELGMNLQAKLYGKRIRLVKFVFSEVIKATAEGSDT